jgi:hypothetical protein
MPLSEMKAGELKALAKEKGIKGADGMNKAALLVALGSENPAPENEGKKTTEYQAHMASYVSKKEKKAMSKIAAKDLKFQTNVKGE